MDIDDNGSSSDSHDQLLDSFDLMDLIVFRCDSLFITSWRLLHVVTCILSSYLYAYLGIFGFEGNEFIQTADHFFFAIFTVSMILNCLTEFYENQGDKKPCRDVMKIFQRYLKTTFIIDFLAWLPVHYILEFGTNHVYNSLFVVKTIRIGEGLQLF